MTVYFARRQADAAIKIGYTWKPCGWMRICDFGKSTILLAQVAGDGQEERRFQSYFEQSHIGGEWFTETPELMAVIARINAGQDIGITLPARGWDVTKPYQTKASIAYHGPLSRLAGKTPPNHWEQKRLAKMGLVA